MGIRKFAKASRFIQRAFLTKKPRIGYVGGYQGHSNLGDEAIYAALKQLFCSGNFIDYDRGLVPNSLVRHLPRCDLMLMAGGTTVAGSKASSYEWAKTCFDCSPHRVIFGSGVVDPELEFMSAAQTSYVDNQRRWADIINSCDYIGVRGPLSQRLLRDWGIADVEVIGDPVLRLALDKPTRSCSTTNDVIGLNVGQARGSVWGSERQICEQFTELARIASSAGFRVKWFVVWPGDLPVTKQAARDSKVEADIHRIYENYKGYLDTVSFVDVFVGMKLHAVALATCAYVPSVMLEYNPKCRDYMESIEQGHNTLRTDRLTASNAWDIASNLLAARSSAADSIFAAVSKLSKLQSLRASQLSERFGLKRNSNPGE